MRLPLVGIASCLSLAATAKTRSYVSYTADGVECLGFMTYDSSKCTAANKCPAVMIIQDWNGMNDYEIERACMIADMGYVAFAADIYGVDTPKSNMGDWAAASTSHRSNATMYMGKIHGAFTKLLEYDVVDENKLAAMGYCFGGTGLVNVAMVGHTGFPGISFPTGLLGVVSFHGGLSSGYATPQTGTRPKLLLHSGGKDDSNEDISKLTNDLESVDAVYEIVRYGPDVLHSFTEWDANTPNRAMYHDRADFRSWTHTMDFLHEIFTAEDLGTSKPSHSECPIGGPVTPPSGDGSSTHPSGDGSSTQASGDVSSTQASGGKGTDASESSAKQVGTLLFVAPLLVALAAF